MSKNGSLTWILTGWRAIINTKKKEHWAVTLKLETHALCLGPEGSQVDDDDDDDDTDGAPEPRNSVMDIFCPLLLDVIV